MMKKIVSFALLISIILCSSVSFAATVNFSDMNASHWAYNSVFELVSKGTVNGYPDGTFRPSGIVTYAEFEKMITGVWKNNTTPITREAALDMLWFYSDKPTSYSAPGIITDQMKNKDAVAWGYSTGLMQGNDGLNLRPNDTLTRAEAATLIIRSTKKAEGDFSFVNSVSEDLLKLIWESYGVFDGGYVANETVTAEQINKAASELGDFIKSKDIFKSNTIEDAAIALIYSSVLNSELKAISVKNASIVSDKYGFLPQFYAAYGLENGIVLPKAKTEVATKRDIALLLIQIDSLVGRGGIKVNKDMTYYPANYKDYQYLAEGVPVKAYATPFDKGAKPANYFDFVNTYTTIFEMFATEMQGKLCKGQATFTLIPSLVAQNKDEAIARVKCTITGNTTAYALFGAGFEHAGKEFYVDLHAGDVVTNIYIPTDNARLGNFICNQ